MRKFFAELLHKRMAVDESIYLLTGDLGYGLWDKIKIDYPDRFIDVGSSEQLMIGTAVGLALSDKKPFVYSITPFLLYRPFELIRNYINKENIPVVLVGGGRDKDYDYLGFSHWAVDDKDIMKNFSNIECLYPDNEDDLNDVVCNNIFLNRKPFYINLKK